jgi:nucleoside-diphosphate-sugar epimerase
VANSKVVLLTGSQGFIGSYVCGELLSAGYKVIGVDDYSKYGPVVKPHDHHPGFRLIKANCSLESFKEAFVSGSEKNQHLDYVIAGAAKIGGIAYFHKHAYDLIAANERIVANTFDIALDRFRKNQLDRIVVISSSMVYENATIWPTPEGHELQCPPPASTYGFEKLATEFFAKGAFEQYGLPFTIIRPFNCIGVGEDEAIGEDEMLSGNVKMLMSHVVPDLVHKCLEGQDPLHILGTGNQIRHFTNGKDIARGIRMALESKAALNQDFNIAIAKSTTILKLAELIWRKTNDGKPFRWVSDPSFKYDVQKRIPATSKAKDLLGFEAQIGLSESLDEVIEWMRKRGSHKLG